MKKYFLILLLFLITNNIAAQRNRTYVPPNGRCGLINPRPGYIINAQGFLDSVRQSSSFTQAFTTPYLIKIFVRIFRDDNGNNAATTPEEVVNRVAEMNGQFSSDNICFLLTGIDVINDSYANFQMTNDNLLDSDYKPYLSGNYALSGVMTLFIHDIFVSSGSSGNAYDIPNNFLSIAGWAANDPDINSIYGHEMGHCLGLYHTFQARRNSQNITIRENVTRTSGNSCYNCPTEGDYCCDTPADHPDIDDSDVNNSCTYIGTRVDGCSVAYNPSVVNIMSYMPWECISTTGTAVTSNQATRVHATINDAGGPVYSRIAIDNQTVSSNENLSSGWRIRGVRTDLTFDATSIIQSGTVQSYNAAGNSITIKPGAHFLPGGGGNVSFRVHTICQ